MAILTAAFHSPFILSRSGSGPLAVRCAVGFRALLLFIIFIFNGDSIHENEADASGRYTN
jgi:hypothetical protein